MSQLPEPRFIETDQQSILDQCIADYEALTGRTLYPAQSERLLINLIAYREHLMRVGIQEAAKQNLVRYAKAPMLDLLGELVGVTRLPAAAASCAVRFSLEQSLTEDLPIPAGIIIYSRDGGQRFITREACRIPAGELSAHTFADAAEAGEAGNGILAGGLSRLADPLADAAVTVSNTETSSGGSDAETDEHLRERITIAPEAFSVAGSRLAYRYHTLSASPQIVDVGVLSPEPGVVDLYPLTADGLPGAGLLALIQAHVSGEKVRPLTDTVHVLQPECLPAAVRAELTLYTWADEGSVREAAMAALSAWMEERRQQLGMDIVRSQLIAILSVYGVYRVQLLEPAADQEVGPSQWVDWRGSTLILTAERRDG